MRCSMIWCRQNGIFSVVFWSPCFPAWLLLVRCVGWPHQSCGCQFWVWSQCLVMVSYRNCFTFWPRIMNNNFEFEEHTIPSRNIWIWKISRQPMRMLIQIWVHSSTHGYRTQTSGFAWASLWVSYWSSDFWWHLCCGSVLFWLSH